MNTETKLLEIARRADEFFMNQSPIHQTMRKLSSACRELNIDFAIAGAMAANAHGHRHTTADVAVLLRRDDLHRFKTRWLGLGWVEKFAGSKGLRDTDNNVVVDVLLTGDYPGDGLKKPVVFPAPEMVQELQDDELPYLNLVTLIELKLASGMTALHRLQDLADVLALIKINRLPLDYTQQLNPYVHDKFVELWHAGQVEEDY